MSPEQVSRLVLRISFPIWFIYGNLVGFAQWRAAVVFGLVAVALRPGTNSLWIAVAAPIAVMLTASTLTKRYTQAVRARYP